MESKYTPWVDDARSIFQAALAGVAPDALLARHPIEELCSKPIESYRRRVVIGVGKASLVMASAIERRLACRVDEGLVVVPHGYTRTAPEGVALPEAIEVTEAGHPVPDRAGVDAALRALEMARDCDSDDLLIALISGGGSALWPAMAEGISLDDARAVSSALLKSGATIHEFNTVRKHISQISGGRLAAAASPAETIALVISDVPGDELPVIASGPTVPDPSTFADAADILHRYDLWTSLPDPVRHRIEHGLADPQLETPKPGDPVFDRVQTRLAGCNRDALEAARIEAERLGYRARIVSDRLEGEAREVGEQLAHMALGASADSRQCLIWGGETTVTIRGTGRGGRNQEVALSAALALDAALRSVVLLSGGTDGVDGPTDAAGAIATPQSASQARRLGLDPHDFLNRNDAYTFFQRIGGLIQTGPTHTNVMDVQIALVG